MTTPSEVRLLLGLSTPSFLKLRVRVTTFKVNLVTERPRFSLDKHGITLKGTVRFRVRVGRSTLSPKYDHSLMTFIRSLFFLGK